MVYGNKSFHSGAGFCFSRNPSTGEKGLFGEFVFNAEGDEVLTGQRSHITIKQLGEQEPQIFEELESLLGKLERHYSDMQDVEFVVEDGALRLLQTRCGQRTAKASVKIAVDMVREGLSTERAALLRVDAKKMDYFTRPQLDLSPGKEYSVLTSGYPASHGAACGKLAFCAEDVQKLVAQGHDVILCRREVLASDMVTVKLCVGVITLEGNLTSEGAVLCRSLGKVCVTGLGNVLLGAMSTVQDNTSIKTALLVPNGPALFVGDDVTLDGSR